MTDVYGAWGCRGQSRAPGRRLVLTLWLPGSPVYVSSDPPRNNGTLYWARKRQSNSDPAGSCLTDSSWRQTWWEGGAEKRKTRGFWKQGRCFSSALEFSSGELCLWKKTTIVSTAPSMTSRNARGWVRGLGRERERPFPSGSCSAVL